MTATPPISFPLQLGSRQIVPARVLVPRFTENVVYEDLETCQIGQFRKLVSLVHAPAHR